MALAGLAIVEMWVKFALSTNKSEYVYWQELDLATLHKNQQSLQLIKNINNISRLLSCLNQSTNNWSYKVYGFSELIETYPHYVSFVYYEICKMAVVSLT